MNIKVSVSLSTVKLEVPKGIVVHTLSTFNETHTTIQGQSNLGLSNIPSYNSSQFMGMLDSSHSEEKSCEIPAWASNSGSRLIYNFRSQTQGLNEDLGGHRGRKVS